MFANFIYLMAMTIASPWIVYRMVRHGRYRRGGHEKLFGISKSKAKRICGGPNRSPVWIHAVSVGEINLIGSVVRQLRERDPGTPVVVSTSTDTGYDLAVQKFGEDHVFFCPLDFTWAVGRTLRRLKPKMLVLVELELWPNLVSMSRQAGVEVMVINARLSEKSSNGYQRVRPLTRPIFSRLSHVACQDELTAERFVACGADPQCVEVTGSLKFDNAPDSRDNAEVQSRVNWANIDPWHRVWIVGSTQEGEEAMALRIYDRLAKKNRNLRLILVPRHRERFDSVAQLVQEHGFKVRRRSIKDDRRGDQWDADTVLLVDSIGELRHWWGVGQIATVGGSFGNRGGQNMLEPAGYGNAVCFGPDTRNFDEIANRLINAGGAMRVADEPALEKFVEICAANEPMANELGRLARKVIAQHCGATERTMTCLLGPERTLARAA
ncbi:3-deoxy-D-manno-octulosonic acid transferase [Rhodopirellula sp. MGV]|uniref:3-deoxy-D-manno-octulosonic acid transferase n=1 Tax=Rhodopirellula sp. MGV TaxID=2023130 RepID=UPI000B968B8D|nr:3-deoxy-D-manno-octulosonic acid transferase [Rhodopirellula sp. MGV]OYP29503.1 3-deoxy-D-manno-octulosonic acid transferase [Rhodopirellula sp. MGV]PNY33808.1 3-deoxy-D-manno-octulosonic acid transferase [Rhodopirellula baltica]